MSSSSSDTRVGACGFRTSHERTFTRFDVLEVQKTFYQPPQISTAERWRSEAPDRFAYTLKAWQLITHEASSPTYRRRTDQLTDEEKSQVGSFRWNEVTRRGWERTRAIANALDAEGIVFQTPASFEPCDRQLDRLRSFFSSIDRGDRYLVFEPRGDAWTDEVLTPLVEDLDLVHGVDPFIRSPVGPGLRYYRLHGRPAYAYSYGYTESDLEELRDALSETTANRVLFNNSNMVEDAVRFIDRTDAGQRET